MSFLPYQNLLSATENNYSIARTYYATKKQNFKKLLRQDFNLQLNTFSQNVADAAQKFANEHFARQNNKLQVSEQKSSNNIFEMDSEKIVKNFSIFKLGFEFEKFMEKNLSFSSRQEKKISEFALRQLDSTVKQSAFTTTNKSLTRTDNLFMSKTANISNEQIGQLEFIKEIIISDEMKNDVNIVNTFIAQKLKDFSMSKVKDLYGFQLKMQGQLNDKRWMNSSIFRSLLIQEFEHDHIHTWSSNYAQNYIVYWLSQRLFNIINPVNIGIIYLQGIIFMDDFLKRYRFYMEISAEDTGRNASSKRGGGKEIKNIIPNETILMREINGQSEGLITTGLRRQAKYNKKIRVLSIKDT